MGNLAQRYVSAVGSGNLKSDELHYDTDVLAAVALSSHFGGMLFRAKYFNDPASFRRLLNQWTWMVSRKGLHRNWPLHIPIDKVAYLSLTRWINSVCPACTGTGKIKIFNAPTLSDKDCRLCNGSGQTELRCDERIRDYVEDMIEELFTAEYQAASKAARKLRRDGD